MPVDAVQAEKHIATLNQRKIATIPEHLRRPGGEVYIFNISDQHQNIGKGGLGTFFIPACEPGEDYSDPYIIGANVFEHYDIGEGNTPWTAFEGIAVAEDVLGVGVGNGADYSKWGCFISRTNPPERAEIKAAHAKYAETMRRLVQQADGLALKGDSGLRQIDAPHRKAVAYLKLYRKWAADGEPMQMVECPACGVAVKPGVAVCSHCKAVLDEEKARKYFPELNIQPAEDAAEKKGAKK